MGIVLHCRKRLACSFVLGVCLLVVPTAGARAAEDGVAVESPSAMFGDCPSSDSDDVSASAYEVGPVLQSLADRKPRGEGVGRAGLVALLQPLAASPIEVQGDRLTIHATAAQHRQIGQLLQLWQRTGLRQIALEIRFLSIATSDLDSLPLPKHQLLTERAPKSSRADASPQFDQPLTLPGEADTQVTVARHVIMKPTAVRLEKLTHEQTHQLVEAVQANARANFLQGPQVTLFNGWAATIADVVQRPFVVDSEEAGDAQRPLIRLLTEGTTIHLRATTGERGNDVRLDCRLELAHVGEVESRPLSDSITGQAPQWHRQTIALATDLAAGHSMLIGGSTAERAETREKEPTNVLWRASSRLFQSRGDERPRESTQLYLLVTPRLLEL